MASLKTEVKKYDGDRKSFNDFKRSVEGVLTSFGVIDGYSMSSWWASAKEGEWPDQGSPAHDILQKIYGHTLTRLSEEAAELAEEAKKEMGGEADLVSLMAKLEGATYNQTAGPRFKAIRKMVESPQREGESVEKLVNRKRAMMRNELQSKITVDEFLIGCVCKALPKDTYGNTITTLLTDDKVTVEKAKTTLVQHELTAGEETEEKKETHSLHATRDKNNATTLTLREEFKKELADLKSQMGQRVAEANYANYSGGGGKGKGKKGKKGGGFSGGWSGSSFGGNWSNNRGKGNYSHVKKDKGGKKGKGKGQGCHRCGAWTHQVRDCPEK